MVETLEYILVFGIIASLAGFSISVLGGALPVVRSTEQAAEFSQITNAANAAVLQGSDTTVLSITDGDISCTGGVLTFSAGGITNSSSIMSSCHFQFANLSCLCTLTFERTTSGLDLRVAQ